MKEYRLKHYGEFVSVRGIVWRVEIMQRSEALITPSELTFEDEPLKIEWQDTDVEDTLCGSSATLNIESPGDRTYVDLYTITPGDIRMDVYREGSLFWSGLLDPEFYEEPYERADKYAVSLTFTDLGILDRLKFDQLGYGTLSLASILNRAVQRSGVLCREIDYTTCTTTYFEDASKADLAALSVRTDNFVDEDGEVSTLKEVLEGILQPLGLKMVQRGGVIYIYDLHGLYTRADAHEAEWSGDSSTLGTAKVANNVKISFSAYGSNGNLLPELEFTDKCGLEDIDRADYIVSQHYYDTGIAGYNDDGGKSFALFLSDTAKGIESKYWAAKYFHMEPILSGSKHDGILHYYRRGFGPIERKGDKYAYNEALTEPLIHDGELRGAGREQPVCLYPVFTCKSIYLPKLALKDRRRYFLRLNMEMLLDGRYNPFTTMSNLDDDLNDTKNHEKLEKRANFVFVPVMIELLDDNGDVIAHYNNRGVVKAWSQGKLPVTYECAVERPQEGIWESIAAPGSVWNYEGTSAWREGPATYGEAWLAYYDVKDFDKSPAIGGWKDNTHCIGRPIKRFWSYEYPRYIYEYFKSVQQGQFIPYPMSGGHLRITVMSGFRCSSSNPDGPHDFPSERDAAFAQMGVSTLYSRVRWVAYKAPELTIVRNNGAYNQVDSDDVEYSGYINKEADDKLDIDTICGTTKDANPTARGAYLRTSTGEQITRLVRAGITDHPERLLIGTLYSQYSTRKNTLSGEIFSPSPGLHSFTEQNQGTRLFMLTSEVMDCRADTSDVTLTEFTPDEYIAIEEVED